MQSDVVFLMRTLLFTVVAALALAGCTTPDDADDLEEEGMAASPAVLLEAIPLVTHVQFGVFEQDVFVPREGPLSDNVYRATPMDAADESLAGGPLYAAAEEVEHDPTFMHDGPFARGAALPITLAQWLAASGSASYACVDDTAHVAVALANGVPDGVYTVWNFWLQFTDGTITDGADLPAGPADGSANSFTADAAGAARFNTSWDGCPDASTFDRLEGRSWGVALAYHSDGETHGASPGAFGLNSHVQLFGLAREGSA